MSLFATTDRPQARIRRPGRDRILAARGAVRKRVSMEAKHRFLALGIVLVAASILSPVFATLSPRR
jgi:hypothetical protein